MKGIVFDFDGVIAKSMELHAEAYRRVLAGRAEFTDREVFLREGARSETILRDLCPSLTDDEVAALAKEKQRLFVGGPQVAMYPGALEMLEAIQARVPTGLVTGTRRTNLEALIPDHLPHFTAVMSQESYQKDKPHPEPYQRAAEAMSIDPADLVCVENAIRGIQSATAAGYGHVVGITTTVTAQDLQQADFVATNHAALRGHLESLI